MILIRALEKTDWPSVLKIYEEGLQSGIATFETEVPNWDNWDAKYLKVCRMVAIEGGSIIAWAALSPFSKRAVYRGVAELSIYVSKSARGRKVGFQLLSTLVEKAKTHHFWTLQAAIFPQNKASLIIHEKVGFRTVGVRERIAQRDGIWYDNILLELRF